MPKKPQKKAVPKKVVARDPLQALRASDVAKVKVAITDLDGILRGKYLHRDKFLGAVQGGFVCAMLDDTMSFAASLSRRFEVMVPTLQTSVSYLRPTPIARVIARGEVLRFGASSVTMQGTLRDAAGQMLAVATATAVPRPFPK